jgi:hypothetical protein
MLNAFGCPVLKISLLAGLAKLAFFAALLFTFYSAVGTRPNISSRSMG